MRPRSLLTAAFLPILVLSAGCESSEPTTVPSTAAPATTTPAAPGPGSKGVTPGAPADVKAKPVD